MKTELLLVTMAGIVLSLFLIVGEIAAMRKRARRVQTYLRGLCQSGKFLMFLVEIFFIAMFFLAQPLLVAYLVAKELDHLNPEFSSLVAQQLRQAF